MIRCTGVNVKLDAIRFQNELEKVVGFSLGTADLLGQMAATDYVDKLPILYLEFAEAASFNEGKMKAGRIFRQRRRFRAKDADVLGEICPIQNRPGVPRLVSVLAAPEPDGTNFYIEKIEANIARIRRELARAEPACNFRRQLNGRPVFACHASMFYTLFARQSIYRLTMRKN